LTNWIIASAPLTVFDPEASFKPRPLLRQYSSDEESWIGANCATPIYSTPSGHVLTSVEFSPQHKTEVGFNLPTMSDEDFDELPYYSDVEEDPEYNTRIPCQRQGLSPPPSPSVSAASSSTFSAQSLVVADVYVPGGNFGQFSRTGWMGAVNSLGTIGMHHHSEQMLTRSPDAMRKREWQGVTDSARKRRRVAEEESCEMF
jgi:hypothetical protein